MMAMTSAPRPYFASSNASGRFTLMTMSALSSASALTVAPAAANSASNTPDLTPAPGSTATSAPSALNFFTVSGEAATRGSEGSISLATAIFISNSLFQVVRRSESTRFDSRAPNAGRAISNQILTTVDRERRAGDEAGVVGGEEDHSACDLLRFA